jgi:hypothetical protein
MSFTTDIDAAVARLERAGGLPAGGAVSPERIRAGHRRARDLRAAAQQRMLSRLFTAAAGLPLALLRGSLPAAALRRNLDDPFKRRQRFAAEPTVSTVG